MCEGRKKPLHPQSIAVSNQRCLYYRAAKRLFDLLLTIPALIVLSPALGITALLVRWQLGSPVLFTQQRPGLHGKLSLSTSFAR